MKINMDEVSETLDQVDVLITRLDGVDWHDPESWTESNTSKSEREHRARLNKYLLLLADLLMAASTDVRKQYWQGKEIDNGSTKSVE